MQRRDGSQKDPRSFTAAWAGIPSSSSKFALDTKRSARHKAILQHQVLWCLPRQITRSDSLVPGRTFVPIKHESGVKRIVALKNRECGVVVEGMVHVPPSAGTLTYVTRSEPRCSQAHISVIGECEEPPRSGVGNPRRGVTPSPRFLAGHPFHGPPACGFL